MKRLYSCAVSAVLFLLLPVYTRAAENLVPVGKLIGLQLSTDTIVVVAYDEIIGSCAREAGLKIGDEIVKIGDTEVGCAEDVRSALNGCTDPVQLTIRRDGNVRTLALSPEQTAAGPRLGVYLRQGIAGIGTVTFYDPETGLFGTLGHGVCDGKGNLLAMSRGTAYEAAIQTVKRGACGDPGQLKGSAGADIGRLLKNTPQGVFGITKQGWKGQELPVADYDEIQTGSAVIRTTVSGEDPREYSVEILKIYPEERSDGRNFLLRVTDPRLLEVTGGIVQGMSGSPILQDGRIVGAVTHVLVNDPTRGYGIYIENMLEAAGDPVC